VAFGVLTCISLDLGAGLSASGRVHAWHQAAVSFLRHPLLGAGLGRTIVSVTVVAPSGIATHLTDAHNTWLSIAAHTGVLAVLAFAAVVVVALGPRLSPREGDPVRRALVIALVGALLYQGLSMSMEDMRHLWLLLALLAVAGGRTPAGNDAVSVGCGVASTR
jgi:O-antigen ligase